MNPLMFIPAVTSILGGLLSYRGNEQNAATARNSAQNQITAANFNAQQAIEQGQQYLAAGQRSAEDETRTATFANSRALALAAASGAGAADPGIVTLMARTKGEGAYRAGIRLYEGEDMNRRMQDYATGQLLEGQMRSQNDLARARNYDLRAKAALLDTAGSMFAKYGMGGPKSSGGSFDAVPDGADGMTGGTI